VGSKPTPGIHHFLQDANTFYSQTIQISKMSKNMLVVSVLFILSLSIMISQEANALTRGPGNDSRTTASLDPSKICGNHVCRHGDHSKWSYAISASQREGPGKATGGYQGHIIMHQLVINSLVKTGYTNSTIINTKINDNGTSSK
jgi:hypothetical protein